MLNWRLLTLNLLNFLTGMTYLPLLELSVIFYNWDMEMKTNINLVSQQFIVWLDCTNVQADMALYWWQRLNHFRFQKGMLAKAIKVQTNCNLRRPNRIFVMKQLHKDITNHFDIIILQETYFQWNKHFDICLPLILLQERTNVLKTAINFLMSVDEKRFIKSQRCVLWSVHQRVPISILLLHYFLILYMQ